MNVSWTIEQIFQTLSEESEMVFLEFASLPAQETAKDSAQLHGYEVDTVAHYWLEVNAMSRPMKVREDSSPYGGER